MEFIFILPILLLIFGGHKAAVEPFLNGKMEIDPYTFPTLYRAQKILRARNTKAREKELKAIQQAIADETKKEKAALKDQHYKRVSETQNTHILEVREWTSEFKAVTAEEDRKRLIQAQLEKKAHDEALQRKYAEERKKKIAEENKRVWDKNRDDEARYNAQAAAWTNPRAKDPDDDASYGSRIIDYNRSINVRNEPNTKSQLWGILIGGLKVNIDGWIYGEPLRDPATLDFNNIWFRLADTDKEYAYIWSGGLVNKSTSGLRNLNQTPPKLMTGQITATMLTAGSINSHRLQISSTEMKVFKDSRKAYETQRQLESLKKGVEALPKSLNMGFYDIFNQLDTIDRLSPPALDTLEDKIIKVFCEISDAAGDKPTREDIDDMDTLADAVEAVRTERAKFGTNPTPSAITKAGGLSAPVDTSYELIPNQGHGHHASALYAKFPPPPPIQW